MKLLPVILSGGSGTRLWPLSREHHPKQFLPLVNELSLFQDTLRRIDGLAEKKSISVLGEAIIICNEEHRFLVAEQLRAIDKLPADIVLEPVGRNTAPALTLAALRAEEAHGDVVLLVMPADHAVGDVDAFNDVVSDGAAMAENGAIVTFGIVPDLPATGYGYIKTGSVISDNIFAMGEFVEKPSLDKAIAYQASGEYLWNSGIFMVKPSVWLAQIEKYVPEIATACRHALCNGNNDMGFYRIDREAFAECPSDSIDYAVMEHLTESHVLDSDCGPTGVVLPLDAGWSDVGAWSSLWEVSEQDGNNNAISGDVFIDSSSGNLIRSESRLVVGLGLKDLIVAETADAVMVAHKAYSQDVKKVVDWLKDQKRPESLLHRKVSRPWGSYEGVTSGERFQVKRIIVAPGEVLSLQMHHHRAEHWVVVRGTANIVCGDKEFLLCENESTYIPIGVKHQLSNPGHVPLEIIEVQSGAYLGEDDIVRFSDRYGRKDS